MRTRRGFKLARVGKVFEDIDDEVCLLGYEDDDDFDTESHNSDKGNSHAAERSRVQPPCQMTPLTTRTVLETS